MSKQADYDALARGFLDLWQDQATRMARDPEMRTFAEQWMALFMPFAQAPAEPGDAAGREHDGFAPDYRTRSQRIRNARQGWGRAPCRCT